MKITKTNLILGSLLAIATIASIVSVLRTQKLKQKLQESQDRQMRIANMNTSQKKLLQIDSMLVKGQYKFAISAYKKQFDTAVGNSNTDIKLRIELAQQLMNFSLEAIQEPDSLSVDNENQNLGDAGIATPKSIRQYDSLSFILKKMRVQLDRTKKQLANRSTGEYLTFKNPKKHKLHYVGQVKNNKANGRGIALFDTGSRYEGSWEDNLRQGEGAFYWTDGQYYIGEYQNDRRSGTGTYFWPNGEKYTGQWKNDQRDGQGIFYGKDGKIITKGIWKNDKLVEELKNKK